MSQRATSSRRPSGELPPANHAHDVADAAVAADAVVVLDAHRQRQRHDGAGGGERVGDEEGVPVVQAVLQGDEGQEGVVAADGVDVTVLGEGEPGVPRGAQAREPGVGDDGDGADVLDVGGERGAAVLPEPAVGLHRHARRHRAGRAADGADDDDDENDDDDDRSGRRRSDGRGEEAEHGGIIDRPGPGPHPPIGGAPVEGRKALMQVSSGRGPRPARIQRTH